MSLQRRDVLKGGLALSAAALMPRTGFAFAPKPEAWRQFQVVTRVELAVPKGPAQAWVPVPAVSEADWFKPLGSTWTTNGTAASWRDPKYGAELVHATWAEGTAAPAIEVTSKFATRDRNVDPAKPSGAALSEAERKLYTASTDLIPTDGIVKETSDKICAGKTGDLVKARAIYEWVVDNTFREPKTRGCGIGDIGSMLKLGNLGGKCADLNALYVGLARAAGLPARDVYGLRVAPSKFGYKSLGTGSEVVTKAQHCRAEVFLSGLGWLPVDPADVRKVVLEEPPGKLALDDPKVTVVRQALFGSWEMNWLAYNFGHDIKLPGSAEPPVGFLMYPQAEIGGKLIDSLDPDTFKYTITAKEIAA